MNEEQLEQPNLNGSNENLGKFKDAESLLKAYTNLQAEFTKKSQRLATLENDIEQKNMAISKQVELNKRVEDFVSKFDIVKPFSSALKETLTISENANLEEEAIRLISNTYKTAEDYSKDSDFLNNYIYSNQEIKDNIIKDYLSKLTQNSPIKVNNGGSSITLTPPNVPTNIKEAGRLAKSIIKQK